MPETDVGRALSSGTVLLAACVSRALGPDRLRKLQKEWPWSLFTTQFTSLQAVDYEVNLFTLCPSCGKDMFWGRLKHRAVYRSNHFPCLIKC